MTHFFVVDRGINVDPQVTKEHALTLRKSLLEQRQRITRVRMEVFACFFTCCHFFRGMSSIYYVIQSLKLLMISRGKVAQQVGVRKAQRNPIVE